jgi:hypothetical protein
MGQIRTTPSPSAMRCTAQANNAACGNQISAAVICHKAPALGRRTFNVMAAGAVSMADWELMEEEEGIDFDFSIFSIY